MRNIKLSVRNQFNPATLATSVANQNAPHDTLLKLKNLAIQFADEQKSPLPPDISQEALILLGKTSQKLHAPLLANFEKNFNTSWAFARFLHRLNKHKDALGWIEHSLQLEPENRKVLARKAEIFLDLHKETPRRGYAHQALKAARRVHKLEKSQYTKNLLKTADVAISEQLSIDGKIVYDPHAPRFSTAA